MKINETGELTPLKLGYMYRIKRFFRNVEALIWMIRRGL